MAIVSLVVDAQQLPLATSAFIKAKQAFFPQKCSAPMFLDNILAEVKGADVRASSRSNARNDRRHSTGFLDRIMQILEECEVSIVGRVWIKAIHTPLDPRASYTFAIQDIARHFEHFLAERGNEGVMICDGRMHNQNSEVAHSIFTQKHSSIESKLPHVLEAPLFGSSRNHAFLQLADLVASSLVFPIAARAYCAHQWSGVHTDPNFDALRTRYAERLRALAFHYEDATSRRRGGIVVSDKLRNRPSSELYRLP